MPLTLNDDAQYLIAGVGIAVGLNTSSFYLFLKMSALIVH
jgi:hypothetical protein